MATLYFPSFCMIPMVFQESCNRTMWSSSLLTLHVLIVSVYIHYRSENCFFSWSNFEKTAYQAVCSKYLFINVSYFYTFDTYWEKGELTYCFFTFYSGGYPYEGHEHSYGHGQESMPIWLSDLECRGSEDSIVDCEHIALDVEACSHSQDAGIRCG